MKLKTMAKRIFAFVLCAVMLTSCWVFTAPSASAAENTDPCYRLESGDANPVYHVEMDVYIYDAGNGYDRNFLGTQVGNPGGGWMIWQAKHYKDMGGVILWYKDNNGTGTENTKSADFSGNYTTTVYRKSTNAAEADDSMFPTSSSNNRDIWDDGYYTLCWDLSGFPTAFMAYNNNDNNNSTYADWEVRQLRVYPYDSSVSIPAATNNRYSDAKATTLFSGAVRTKNTDGSKTCHYKVYQYGHAEVWQENGFSNEYDSNSNCKDYNYVWYDSFSSGQDAVKKNNTPDDNYAVSWAMPKPQFIDYDFTENGSYTAGPDVEATLSQDYVYPNVDQYGATLAGTLNHGFELVANERSADNSTWETDTSGTTSCTVDTSTSANNITITPVRANGYQYHRYSVRPTTEWIIGGAYINVDGAVNGKYYGSTKSATFDFSPKTVTYKYYATNTSAPTLTDADNEIYDSWSTAVATSVADSATNAAYTAFYGDSVSAVPAADKYTDHYYDASGHYSGGAFTAYGTITENDTKLCTYSAPVAHSWSAWTEIANDDITENMSPDTYHRAVCTVNGETHYEYQVHHWDDGQDNPAATCTQPGVLTYTCNDCGKTRDVAISATGHNRVEYSHAPDDMDLSDMSGTGYEYFQCTRCHNYWAAQYNTSEHKYEVLIDSRTGGEDGVSSIGAISSYSTPVPAPSFNTYVDDEVRHIDPDTDDFYFYGFRGASLRRMTTEYTDENTVQDIRFSGSVSIPDGVSYAASASTKADPSSVDNVIIDFGFIYTQDSHMGSNPANLTIENAATPDPDDGKYYYQRMSVVDNNAENGTFNGSNWSGATYHAANWDDDGYNMFDNLTFNLVVQVKAKNWNKLYAARPYIMYKYNGVIYTVYDEGTTLLVENREYSRGSVFGIGGVITLCGNVYGESDSMITYCRNRIAIPTVDSYDNAAVFAAAQDWWPLHGSQYGPADCNSATDVYNAVKELES